MLAQVEVCNPPARLVDLPLHCGRELVVAEIAAQSDCATLPGGHSSIFASAPVDACTLRCPHTSFSLRLTASAVLSASLLAQVMPILALWVTDRQEHELIVGAHQHSCYHCDVPQHLKDQPSPSKLVDAADVCAQPSISDPGASK